MRIFKIPALLRKSIRRDVGLALNSLDGPTSPTWALSAATLLEAAAADIRAAVAAEQKQAKPEKQLP
jgi:hypothetical protein